MPVLALLFLFNILKAVFFEVFPKDEVHYGNKMAYVYL